MTYRLARPSDLVEFYGKLPAQTTRGVVVTIDGRVAGVAGVATEADGTRKLFTEFRDELVPYLSSVTVWRALKAVLQFARTPTYAVASMDGERFLGRLGFTPVSGDIWRV